MKLVLKGTWETVCKRALEYAEEVRSKYGIALTLRALFYYLADAEGLIVHSQTAYKKLSERFARYREKTGKIDILEDKTREYRRYYTHHLEDLREYVKFELDLIADRLLRIAKIPRWYMQRNYVAIWIEKETIALVDEVAREYEIDAFPSRGFSSITKLHEAALILKDMINSGKIPVILVLTDFDPSGVFIEQDYKVKIGKYGGYAEFIRVAMNPDQIAKFDLPSIPHDDPKAERVRRDPRYNRWLEYCKTWGIVPNIIELDAFAGLRPRDFRNVIVKSIENFFDRRTYEEVVKKIEEERIKEAKEIIDKIKGFISRL